MKRKIFLILFAVISSGLVAIGSYESLRQDRLVAPIAEQILRFHVLANSDSEEDQELKLNVKAALLNHMEENLEAAASAQEIETYVNTHEEELSGVAEQVIQTSGYSYPVAFSIENCYFPQKTYGDMTFPSGTYRALRVEIGKADGQNWWCVLYPPLCFTDVTNGIVPEESKEKLENMLSEEDYNHLTDEVEAKFWIVEFLSEVFSE